MSKTYFGFAFSASMLPAGNVILMKEDMSIPQVREALDGGCELCLNPNHTSTIAAARERFGLPLSIPERPASIKLNHGDRVIVMQVEGLPRLTDRHEYTSEEIAAARFGFVELMVR